MLQASAGIWQDTQLRPFVPLAWKYSLVRSTKPWVLNVPAWPPGFLNRWLLSMLVSTRSPSPTIPIAFVFAAGVVVALRVALVDLLGRSVAGTPPQGEQRNHRDYRSRLIVETPQITSLHCSHRRLHGEFLPAL